MSERRTEDLINKIGGERRDIARDAAARAEEVNAMRELGSHLGMEGFPMTEAGRYQKIEQAQQIGQDPERYFVTEWAMVNREIQELERELKNPNPHQEVVMLGEGSAEWKKQQKERQERERKILASKEAKLQELRERKKSVEAISKALASGDIAPALHDLELQIDFATAELDQVEQQTQEAMRDERYKNLMEHARSIADLVDQSRAWPDIAAVHEAAARLYEQSAIKAVGLDALEKRRAKAEADRSTLRAMVKNLELYKKV